MTLRVSGGRRLQSPPGASARPTASRVRLAMMNLLAADIPGCRWLDLCCGSGAMACEALQRGAAEVVAVESDRRVAAVARANLAAVGGGRSGVPGETAPRWRVECADVLRWLQRSPPAGFEAGLDAGFDLIYVDPPYAAGLYTPVAAAVQKGGWLKATGTMVWECASDSEPTVPQGWTAADERRYGGTRLVLLRQERNQAADSTDATPVSSP